MQIKELKPLIWGAVLGCLIMAIVTLAMGWVTLDGVRDRQVREARVAGQADVCASLAQAHRSTTGDKTEIAGYSGRARREELAKSFAVKLPGQERASTDLVSACSDLLDRTGI
ncbi:MAG: hypothetical protein EXQ85_08560 [Alphaproteobacteria bacterium]|nr:hypothetical protein [Alphaproteobacteria bacterium]